MHLSAQCEHRGMNTGERQLPVHREQAWCSCSACSLVRLLDVTVLDMVVSSPYKQMTMFVDARACFGTCVSKFKWTVMEDACSCIMGVSKMSIVCVLVGPGVYVGDILYLCITTCT